MQKNSLVHFFSRISPVLVALAYVPWVIFLYLIIANYVLDLTANDKDTIQKFIEWFGTAYSLFLALVLGYVWTQFDNLDREFDLEVDAMASLHQIATYTNAIILQERPELDNEKKSRIKFYIDNIENEIVKYVKHVIKYYQVEHSNTKQNENGEKMLARIGEYIGQLSFDALIPDTIVSELFRSLNEATDIRGDRIAHSKQRMNSAVWLVAFITSLVWLLPFLSLIIDDGYVFILLVGGASFVIIMVLTIVKDLDDPFDGAWKVNINSWYQFLERIEPTLIFVFNIKNTLYEREFKIAIGKVFRFQVCKLRDLTYKWYGFGRNEWIELSSRIQDQTYIYIKELMSDQYFEDVCFNELNTTELPIIIYRSRDNFRLLLTPQEISNCTDLPKLNQVIKEKLTALNISYTVE